jgi:ABC-2 type transport system permease protein
MSWTMARKALWDLRWPAFWYALGLALYTLLIGSIYPTVREQSAQFEEIVRNYPEALLRAFGIEPGKGLLINFSGFMHAETYGFIWPLVASIFVIMAGAATVAQEVERGTAELWLAVPVSRSRLLASKIAALLVGMLVIVLVSVLSLLVAALLVDAELSTGAAAQLGVVLLDFLIAVGGLAVLFSALASERGKAAAATAAVVLAMYLAWVIAGISERFDWLRYASIFTAYRPREALEGSGVSWAGLLALLAIGLGGALASLAIFRRRDILA